jgi:hypothetical protein
MFQSLSLSFISSFPLSASISLQVLNCLHFSKYYFCVHMNEDGMGGACIMYERDKTGKVPLCVTN